MNRDLHDLYEEEGLDADFTPVDTMLAHIGASLVVGFAMMEQGDDA